MGRQFMKHWTRLQRVFKVRGQPKHGATIHSPPLTFFEGLVCIYKTRQKKGKAKGGRVSQRKACFNNPFFELSLRASTIHFFEGKGKPYKNIKDKGNIQRNQS